MNVAADTCLWAVTAPASSDRWRGPAGRATRTEWNKAWFAAHPEKVEEYRQRRYEKIRAERIENPAAWRLRLDKQSARRAGTKEAWTTSTRRSFAAHVLREYGLTVEDYARLEHAQGRGCAACREPLRHPSWEDRRPGKQATKDVHVDHCHATGAVRGILCGGCNKALGALRESPERLLALAAYAEKTKEIQYVAG